MRYEAIDPQLFIDNRARFSQQMKEGSLAIFHSNDLMPKSADAHHPFHQNPDLFYLSGVDQEDTILILYPDSPIEKYKEVLFVRETNDHIKVWEGEKLTIEKAKEVSGVETVLWNSQYESILGMLMNQAEHVYLNLNEHDRASNPVPDKDLRFAREMKERYPLHHYIRSAPIMHHLRAYKHEIEIELMRKAASITGKAFRRVLQFVKPGVMEYEIEAEVTHEFIRNGANGHAYTPIVASGKNSCILHYIDNDQPCKDGDIILFDFGAAYANYASDMSRTIPVNGKFTPRQKDVYNATYRVMQAAMQLLTPGTLIEDYHKEVGKLMESELIGLGLLDKATVAEQDPEKPLYKKYFMHGTSHFLGLDTHDVGNRYEPIKAGMVFTVEPGIYIPEENLGVRLENDIFITANGYDDLMATIPLEADEIEDLMNT